MVPVVQVMGSVRLMVEAASARVGAAEMSALAIVMAPSGWPFCVAEADTTALSPPPPFVWAKTRTKVARSATSGTLLAASCMACVTSKPLIVRSTAATEVAVGVLSAGGVGVLVAGAVGVAVGKRDPVGAGVEVDVAVAGAGAVNVAVTGGGGATVVDVTVALGLGVGSKVPTGVAPAGVAVLMAVAVDAAGVGVDVAMGRLSCV